MALMEEATQAFGERLPGGASVGAGSFWNVRTNAIYQNTADSTLPAMDWWFQLPGVAGNASLATCATQINTSLNAVSPIAGNYAYVAANLHAYISSDLPQSRGQGACDA